MSSPYDRVVGRQSIPTDLISQDPTVVQAKMDWLSSSITQKMVAGLKEDSNALVDDAMALAVVNHQSDNSKQIIHKLIEANALRKVIGKYVHV